jgi:cell wall assembly regulator SMI1
MEKLWNHIKDWMRQYAPELLKDLNPGATEADFQALETMIGVTLPEDFKDFYRVHNGQTPTSQVTLWGSEELLSTQRIAEEWKVWKDLYDAGEFKGNTSEPDMGIRNDWWNPKWIPLTYDGAGNHDCLDLDPAADGVSGQVIRMWHDDETRELVGEQFGQWVAYYVEDLQEGRFVYQEEYGIVEAEA